jgi:alpha-tubulin suppressor-like RCC1 family protein
MVRHNSRARSDSAASASKKTKAPSSLNTSSASCVEESLRKLTKRDKYGRTKLHRLASGIGSCSSDVDSNYHSKRQWQNVCLATANDLLKLATADHKLLRQLLTIQDLESGYTALHRAIFCKNLPMILLLLRSAAIMDYDDGLPSNLKNTNYIGLLEYSGNNFMILQEMISIKDNEGYTPIQLLGTLYSTDLENIRKSKDLYSYGTEVLTFGSAGHPALGQYRSKAKASLSSNNRVTLGRVEEFATACPIDCNKAHTPSAVKLAVATHHTLILTANGHLYAFGLGNGGRLGLGTDHSCSAVLKPMRVPLPLNRYVMSIAAAENHSLCTTSDGSIYAWGSNQFGQLGTSKIETSVALAPVRVASLKGEFITHVAAGDRHSVALTRDGHVCCFGDNNFGQLGWLPTPATKTNPVGKVMWLASSKTAMAIAASDKSTMALTKPQAASSTDTGKFGEDLLLSKINSVYVWGNGNYMPTRVNFPVTSSSTCDFSSMIQRNNSKNSSARSSAINPVAIACAKRYYVALTEDGKCYTWGLHEEKLTHEQPQQQVESASKSGKFNHFISDNQISMKNSHVTKIMSVPQLVTGMLPENGGGAVFAVSASDNHVAVLTSAGHLYRWGVSDGEKNAGHEGVKNQPVQRVKGVFHATGLAAAREHTALLIGTKYPHLFSPFTCEPSTDDVIPSLQNLCELKIAENIDLFNVVPLFLMADSMSCTLLAEFSSRFIQSNLDTVLSFCKEKDLDSLLEESLLMGYSIGNLGLHYDFKSRELNKTDCIPNLAHEPSPTDTASIKSGRVLPRAFHEGDVLELYSVNDGPSAKPSLNNLQLVNELSDLNNPAEVLKRYDALWKAFRTLKKKLKLVLELEESLGVRSSPCKLEDMKLDYQQKFTKEQHEKISRRPQLEADLLLVKPALDEACRRMEHFNLLDQWARRKSSIDEGTDIVPDHVDEGTSHDEAKFEAKFDCSKATEAHSLVTSFASSYLCEVCNIRCPDAISLSFHMKGRKHQNWVQKLKLQEQQKSTECAAKPKASLSDTEPKSVWRGCHNNDSEHQKDAVHGKLHPSDCVTSSDPTAFMTVWAQSIHRNTSQLTLQNLFPNSPRSRPDSGTFCNQTKAKMLREIIEEEKQHSKVAVRQQQESTERKSTKIPMHSFAGKKPASSSIQGTTPRQTTGISQIWDRNCVTGSLKKHAGSHVLLSAEPPSPHSLSSKSLQIRDEEKQPERDTISVIKPKNKDEWDKVGFPSIPIMKMTPGDKPQRNMHGHVQRSDEFVGKSPLPAKSKEEALHPDRKEKGPKTPAWQKSLVQNIGTKNDSQPTRSLLEIQQEETDLKQKSCDTAKGTIWFVERRERAPSFGDIQQSQEEEEMLLSFLIQEQRFIEDQIAKEATSKRLQQRSETKKKGKVTHLQGKMKYRRSNALR